MVFSACSHTLSHRKCQDGARFISKDIKCGCLGKAESRFGNPGLVECLQKTPEEVIGAEIRNVLTRRPVHRN